MEENNIIIEMRLQYLIEWAHKLANSKMILDNVRKKVDGIIKQELRNDLKNVTDCVLEVNLDIRRSCIGETDRMVEIEENGIEKENE